MVISKKLYTTQEYCNEFLGIWPVVMASKDELREILDTTGRAIIWDYPLDKIDEIIENNLDVVLVDTTYVDENTLELVNEYRWFEIPKED